MTESPENQTSRASMGMVIFIVAMVTLAAVGQLFIKHGVNTFETVTTLEETNGAVLVPHKAVTQSNGVDAVRIFTTDGERVLKIFEPLGEYSEGVLTESLDAGEKIIVIGNFPRDLGGFLRMVFYWPVFIGLVIYFFFGFAWLKILGSVPVSFAFPFLALGYIVIIVGSALLLGESINGMKVLAIVLIIGGVICLSRSDTSEQSSQTN